MRAFKQQGDGIQVTAGLSTASSALPTLENGNNPKIVRVTVVENTATSGVVGAHVVTGQSSVTATALDHIYVGYGFSVVLYCAGDTHIAYIRAGSVNETINVVPLE